MSRAHQQGDTWANRRRRAAWLRTTDQACALRLPGCTSHATTVDDITPLSAGGVDAPANWRPACRPCNSRRGNRSDAELERLRFAAAAAPVGGRAGLLVGPPIHQDPATPRGVPTEGSAAEPVPHPVPTCEKLRPNSEAVHGQP